MNIVENGNTGDNPTSLGPEADPPREPVCEDDSGEFHIVVRKLELPIRPRGVLAE